MVDMKYTQLPPTKIDQYSSLISSSTIMSRSSRSSSPPPAMKSPIQACRHYYAKLDIDAQTPLASALPIPKWFQQSSSIPSLSDGGHESETDLDIAIRKPETKERDIGQPLTESVFVCPSNEELSKSVFMSSTGSLKDNPIEVKERNYTPSTEESRQRYKHQHAAASNDNMTRRSNGVLAQERESHRRDWAMLQRLKLYNFWVEIEVTLLHLTARLERVTARIAQLETMELMEDDDETYGSG